MRKKRSETFLDVKRAREDREFLEAMAEDVGSDTRAQGRAKLILALLDGADLPKAAAIAKMGTATAKDKIVSFNAGGWKALLTVMSPRGGDFIARYDQGFWAERLTRTYLDQSLTARAIPYGTSRSEPFTDMQSFRQHMETEFLLQAWSAKGRWKRPDLLLIPRSALKREKGNDSWTPDLQHLDNENCERYVRKATAAVEVETSLWQAKVATVSLSFTVKKEDLEALRSWIRDNRVPLFIVQVFYDCAYVLPFATLEEVISLPEDDPRYVPAITDSFTNKPTYKVPLLEGALLGDIAEPDVEGKVFKAPNGRVTVYGRLAGSAIKSRDLKVLTKLVNGSLATKMDTRTAAKVHSVREDDADANQGPELF
jgi:hypothetical protein